MKEMQFIWDDLGDAIKNKHTMDKLYSIHGVYIDSIMYVTSKGRILNVFKIKNDGDTSKNS